MPAPSTFNAEPVPIATIVVVGWRSAPFLLDCMRSIEANVEAVSYEVIVVLNEPTSELDSSFARSGNGATVIRTRVNLGFAGAVNLGAAQARGEYIVLLNDDAVVEPGWLEALVDIAERRSDLGAVGAKVLFPDGIVQEVGGVIWSDGSATNVGRGLSGDSQRYDFERVVDYCSGCSLLVRRSTWLAVGGLGEEYFPAYYEDVDLCFRIQELGQDVWVQPRSRVTHRLSASTSGSYRSFLLERHRKLFADRWAERLAAHADAPDDSRPVDRAVWRAMGEPMRVLTILDGDLLEDGVRGTLERVRAAATELFGSDDWQLVTVRDSLLELPGAAGMDRADASFQAESLAARLDWVAGPYALVVLAVRALRYELVAGSLRIALPGASVALDAEVLRSDLFVIEEARSAELRAAADVDYLICTSEEVAEALGRNGDPAESAQGLLVYTVRRDATDVDVVPIVAEEQAAGIPAPTGRETVPPAVRQGTLTPVELEALSRGVVLKEAYIADLEAQVRTLMDQLQQKDAHAGEIEAFAKRTEAYAIELTAQVEELAAEIEAKNVYIRTKEAEVADLWGLLKSGQGGAPG